MSKKENQEEFLKNLLNKPSNPRCPIRKTLEMLSGKWRTHVIYELFKNESCRFADLKRAIPKITNTMLTAALRDLEENGIVSREQFNEVPPHVGYSLTEKGRGLLPAFFELSKWSEKYY